jgi:selenocysteine-specific elongation factor
MRVIGTAGHVDHGKSTLIAALTGVHPDRLKEEREREMTIDLGFGWLTLPDGQEVGIVDVPGHRDFIENMLAGVSGLDAVLLIIAADEGVMPQTREHLAILDLLQVKTGIVVITKIDMVEDNDWIDLVETDIRAALAGTVMENAPFARVSAKTGAGLDALTRSLGLMLENTTPRLDLARPRLPIDRVFSIAGFGTVTTGTLLDGHFSVGDDVEILPSGRKGRVRGLQTHKKKEETAIPGSRVAVNISGVAVEEIARGEVVATPGHYQPTRRIDARFRLLKDVSAPLKHATEVKIFAGTSETIANLRILGADVLNPGEEGWIQLELRDPLVVVRGDRYILRRPSPSETLGGGQVVDPHPSKRHKRFDAEVLNGLEALSKGTPAEVLFQAAIAHGAGLVKDVLAKARLESESAQEALAVCVETGWLIPLEGANLPLSPENLVIPATQYVSVKETVVAALAAYHSAFPLRRGMPREELKSRLKLMPRLFNALVAHFAAGGELVEGPKWINLPTHVVKFSVFQQPKVDALLKLFAASPYTPPSVKDCQHEVGDEIYAVMLDVGDLVQVSPEVVFRKADYDAMVAKTREFIAAKGQASAAEVRDLFGTSRKYALALMEHLDAIGVTVRDGDFRKLRGK